MAKIIPFKENIIILIIGIVILMEFMDISILNTSFPQIAFSLNINPINLKVALTSYLLALAAFIPAAGYLTDRFGAKRLLILSIIGFLLGSVLCGLSVNLLMLSLARVLQGIFGAFISPVARIIMVKLFKKRLNQVMAKVVPIFLLGPLIGPLLGGIITTFIGWRFIFFVNIPIGLLSVIVIYYYFPDIQQQKDRQFDWQGFLLMAMSLILVFFAVDTFTSMAIPSLIKLASLLIGLTFAIIYIFYRRDHHTPIINLRVFNNNNYRFYIILMFVIRLVLMDMSFLASLYLQTQYHYTAWEAGLLFAPLVLGTLITKQLIHWFTTRFVTKTRLIISLSGALVTKLVISYLFIRYNMYVYMVTVFFYGICISLTMPSIYEHIYHTLEQKQVSDGVLITSVFRQLSQGVSIAIIAEILLLASGHTQLQWNTVLPKLSYGIVIWAEVVILLLIIFSLHWLPKEQPNHKKYQSGGGY